MYIVCVSNFFSGFDAHLWKEVFCDAIILTTWFCMGCSRYRVDHLTGLLLEFLNDVFGTPNSLPTKSTAEKSPKTFRPCGL